MLIDGNEHSLLEFRGLALEPEERPEEEGALYGGG
jgi:hypothetical protein